MILFKPACESNGPVGCSRPPLSPLRRLALLGLSAIVVGCATSTTPLPQADPAFATISTRFQYHEMGGVRWQSFTIASVDGQRRMRADVADGGDDVKVSPGQRRLVVRSAFHGWPTVADVHGRHEAEMELVVNVESGRVYRLTGEPRGMRHHVWLEDPATKRRVSAEASAAYAPHQMEFHYIPIIRGR